MIENDSKFREYEAKNNVIGLMDLIEAACTDYNY